MSKDTWDFPTMQDRDGGPGAAAGRGAEGAGFGVFNQTLFGNAISGIISFFITPEAAVAADQTGTYHYLHTMGYQNSNTNGLVIYVKNDPAGTGFIGVNLYDRPNAIQRYIYQIGDEDGNGLQVGKWYQFAFSADASSFQYAMNGSTTPLVVGTPTSNPGTLNLNAGTERWFSHGAAASGWTNSAAPGNQASAWSSLLRGPSAFEGSALDLSDAAVRDRIWDADGNLKHPGENGSLWFNDAYTTAANFKPGVYLLDGSERMEQGSLGLAFTPTAGPGTAICRVPGGLRKFYE